MNVLKRNVRSTPRELEQIKTRQQHWASTSGFSFDKSGYCDSFNDNLFGGCLSAEAESEIEQGGGSEFGTGNGRGKFYALHSSSALACNWFDYWRHRDHRPLSAALGLTTPFATLQLEAKLPTGVRGSIANLDVLLTGDDGALTGIESKFCEPYTASDNKFFMKSAYF